MQYLALCMHYVPVHANSYPPRGVVRCVRVRCNAMRCGAVRCNMMLEFTLTRRRYDLPRPSTCYLVYSNLYKSYDIHIVRYVFSRTAVIWLLPLSIATIYLAHTWWTHGIFYSYGTMLTCRTDNCCIAAVLFWYTLCAGRNGHAPPARPTARHVSYRLHPYGNHRGDQRSA